MLFPSSSSSSSLAGSSSLMPNEFYRFFCSRFKILCATTIWVLTTVINHKINPNRHAKCNKIISFNLIHPFYALLLYYNENPLNISNIVLNNLQSLQAMYKIFSYWALLYFGKCYTLQNGIIHMACTKWIYLCLNNVLSYIHVLKDQLEKVE